MVTDIMVDEYYERYRAYPHDQLYAWLRQGSPAQIDSGADVWRTVEDALQALAGALRRDLTSLRSTWTGAGASEFQHRVESIAAYADTLAHDAVALRTGLAVMSGALAQAQQKAEPGHGEASHIDNWLVDGVLGAALGHTASVGQRAKAYERMVVLIAELAAEYAVADRRHWPAEVAVAPAGLPGQGSSVPAPTDQQPPNQPGPSVPAGPVLAAPEISASVDEIDDLASTAFALGGAGLAGATAAAAGAVSYREATTNAEPAQVPGQSTAPMMGGVGAGHTGVGASGATWTDDGAWAKRETVAWRDDSEAPPAVIGEDGT